MRPATLKYARSLQGYRLICSYAILVGHWNASRVDAAVLYLPDRFVARAIERNRDIGSQTHDSRQHPANGSLFG